MPDFQAPRSYKAACDIVTVGVDPAGGTLRITDASTLNLRFKKRAGVQLAAAVHEGSTARADLLTDCLCAAVVWALSTLLGLWRVFPGLFWRDERFRGVGGGDRQMCTGCSLNERSKCSALCCGTPTKKRKAAGAGLCHRLALGRAHVDFWGLTASSDALFFAYFLANVPRNLQSEARDAEPI